jgi:hypothetical protein
LCQDNRQALSDGLCIITSVIDGVGGACACPEEIRGERVVAPQKSLGWRGAKTTRKIFAVF